MLKLSSLIHFTLKLMKFDLVLYIVNVLYGYFRLEYIYIFVS